MNVLRACLDPRVIVGLALVGGIVVVLAPGLVAAAIPLLIVAACPLSMIAMMATMRRSASDHEGPEGSRGAPELRRELADLAARQRDLELELSGLERNDARRPIAQPSSVGRGR
jgi:UPF0716 family protein affecting phage T7 exclusion